MTREASVLSFLLDLMKRERSVYGYDLWLPHTVEQGTLLWDCAVQVLRAEPHTYEPPSYGNVRHMNYGGHTLEHNLAAELYPLAADLLWLLARQGILRPGVREHGGQAVSSGQGYSLTLKGREWIQNYSEEEFQGLVDAL